MDKWGTLSYISDRGWSIDVYRLSADLLTPIWQYFMSIKHIKILLEPKFMFCLERQNSEIAVFFPILFSPTSKCVGSFISMLAKIPISLRLFYLCLVSFPIVLLKRMKTPHLLTLNYKCSDSYQYGKSPKYFENNRSLMQRDKFLMDELKWQCLVMCF